MFWKIQKSIILCFALFCFASIESCNKCPTELPFNCHIFSFICKFIRNSGSYANVYLIENRCHNYTEVFLSFCSSQPSYLCKWMQKIKFKVELVLCRRSLLGKNSLWNLKYLEISWTLEEFWGRNFATRGKTIIFEIFFSASKHTSRHGCGQKLLLIINKHVCSLIMLSTHTRIFSSQIFV